MNATAYMMTYRSSHCFSRKIYRETIAVYVIL